jgi:hypothetical protein
MPLQHVAHDLVPRVLGFLVHRQSLPSGGQTVRRLAPGGNRS